MAVGQPPFLQSQLCASNRASAEPVGWGAACSVCQEAVWVNPAERSRKVNVKTRLNRPDKAVPKLAGGCDALILI
jgi:hypothetical protein